MKHPKPHSPKSDWNPTYMPHPIETLKEAALVQLIGVDWVKEIEEKGLSEKAYLLAALFHVPESFLLNLQKNYDAWKKSHPKPTG